MGYPVGFTPQSPYNTQFQAMQYYSQVGQNLTYNQLQQWNPQYLANWYMQHNQQLKAENAQLHRYVYRQVQSNNALSYIDPYIRNPAAMGYGVQNPDSVYGSQNWQQQCQSPHQVQQGAQVEQAREAQEDSGSPLAGAGIGFAVAGPVGLALGAGGIVGPIISKVGDFAGGLIQGVGGGVRSLADGVGGVLENIPLIGGIAGGIVKTVGNVVGGAVEAVGGVVKGVANAVGDVVSGIGKAVGSIFKGW